MPFTTSVVHLTLDGVNGKWWWRRNDCQIDGENNKLCRQSSEFSDGNAVIYDRYLRCHFWMTPYVHNTFYNALLLKRTHFMFVPFRSSSGRWSLFTTLTSSKLCRPCVSLFFSRSSVSWSRHHLCAFWFIVTMISSQYSIRLYPS